MQKKFDLSPDDLISLEPSDEAMTEEVEPLDIPVRRHERVLFWITGTTLILPRGIFLWRTGVEARFFSESAVLPYLEHLLNWQLFALIVPVPFLIFMAYKLLFPPRLSSSRFTFLIVIMALAYELFSTS